MKVEQRRWSAARGWEPGPDGATAGAGLALVFGSPAALNDGAPLRDLARLYPRAELFGCSTAGEIQDVRVYDETLTATAVAFDRARVRAVSVRADAVRGGCEAGELLAAALPAEGLVHVLVLSDGLSLNASELLRGLNARLPPGVNASGGLAGDGARYEAPCVLAEGRPLRGVTAALGLYGAGLAVGCGSFGGWDPFGPDRLITRSRGNVLHELDGRSALELYKTYLGEHARELPASGLRFPLSLRLPGESRRVVRTVLSVNADHSMTFAGDMPQGGHAQLMKANFDRLIDGAGEAARAGRASLAGRSPELALLISCVGRKLLLQQRVEEEVENVRAVLGAGTALAGFYSYGELSPAGAGSACALHNQTMTVTTLSES